VEKNSFQHHNLKGERQLRGWSQADVAARIGSDPKTVGRWERGRSFPGPYFRQRLVDLYDKDAKALGFVAGQGEHLNGAPADSYSFPSHQEWGEAKHIENFYGREKELTQLKHWMISDHCRLIAILGFGGVGKTTLATMAALQTSDRFDYVFWRSLQHAPPLESIVKNCLRFVSQQQQIDMLEGPDEQISLLIDCLRRHRCLLILDNVESILQGAHTVGHYREGYEGYGKLFQRIAEAYHQSCLLLTCREKPKEIAQMEGKASPIRSLSLAGMGQADVQKLLEDKGLFGTEEVWLNLAQLYSGNPLALKFLSEPIREVFEGDIARFLRESEVIFGDIRVLLEQQFQRLSRLEREIIYWLALEREPVAFHEIREDMAHPVRAGALVEALDSLQQRSMIEASSTGRFRLQPLLMEYITERFIEQIVKEIGAEIIELVGSHALIKARAKDYIAKIKPSASGMSTQVIA
jgi:transcriptional regulator with XRE-family HTH domain